MVDGHNSIDPGKTFEGRGNPFAGIIRIRFNGSPTLPRRTLSLRPAIAEPVGSPLDERKVGPTPGRVKPSHNWSVS